MDYEVFLLARVREEYLRTGDNTEAVGWGLEHTAAIITSAAAIMITVFGAFAFASMVPIKAMGFGLALAVFIDATVVRVVLVPATMRLLGDWNWWLPGWLDRLLPHVELENEPSRSPRNAARRDPWVAPKPALIRRRALSAWSRTWSAPRRRETSGSPPGSGAPSCPGP
jgi:putative drug exporter of the RND superfamily